jgi:hypothetical protein
MIASYMCFDGGALGSFKFGEAVVREKGILGIFQYHHKPHPKTSLHPSQTRCLNQEKNRVRKKVKSLVRNQVGSLVRSRVKSLTPSLSPN